MGINGLCLKNWSLRFNPLSDDSIMFPIWVRLLGPLLEFWDEEVFVLIANSFGQYFTANKVTKFKKRLLAF